MQLPVMRLASTFAKQTGSLSATVVQRSLLDAHRGTRDAMWAGAVVAWGLTPGNAQAVVNANPPDDEYYEEPLLDYTERVRPQLEAQNYHGQAREKTVVEQALATYRRERAEAARRAEETRQGSLRALAKFVDDAENRKGPLIKKIKHHIFEAQHEEGVPKGLHAYTNGAVPANATLLLTVGSTASVHVIVWTIAERTPGKCKWSTMFPINLHQGMVCWFLLHKRLPDDYPTGERPAVPPFEWPAIDVGQSGETNFPIYPGHGEAEVRAAIKRGATSSREVTARSVTTLFITVGGREYQVVN
jgi:hypothetical protein